MAEAVPVFCTQKRPELVGVPAVWVACSASASGAGYGERLGEAVPRLPRAWQYVPARFCFLNYGPDRQRKRTESCSEGAFSLRCFIVYRFFFFFQYVVAWYLQKKFLSEVGARQRFLLKKNL